MHVPESIRNFCHWMCEKYLGTEFNLVSIWAKTPHCGGLVDNASVNQAVSIFKAKMETDRNEDRQIL
jgi:hypothetical protein